MANNTKRCLRCGGTLWLDGDVVKCLMCSRPADGRSGEKQMPPELVHAQLPSLLRKNPLKHTKWDM